MKYYLIRHGQSQFNAGNTDEYDSNLSEKGFVQIVEAALTLKELFGKDLEQVLVEATAFQGFTSPLKRCLDTAMPLHKRWGINFIVDTLLSETPQETKVQRYKLIPNRSKDYPEYTWPEFESFDPDRTQEEYLKGLGAFAKKLPEKAVIVSHMTTIHDLVAIIVGAPFKFYRSKEVGNASITCIENGRVTFMGRR